MPTPVPTPTPAQIVTLADIVMETTASVTTAVAADSDQDISNAKWAQTLLDISAWGTTYKTGKRPLKRAGNVEFYQSSVAESRLDFRNTIRRRYGYSDLVSETAGLTEISSLQWFDNRRCR
jgi:hypothetical protein